MFAGTDAPLSPAELERERLVQIPTAVGGVVPVVNRRGLAPNALVLDGPLLADLCSGKVQCSSDARIQALITRAAASWRRRTTTVSPSRYSPPRALSSP